MQLSHSQLLEMLLGKATSRAVLCDLCLSDQSSEVRVEPSVPAIANMISKVLWDSTSAGGVGSEGVPKRRLVSHALHAIFWKKYTETSTGRSGKAMTGNACRSRWLLMALSQHGPHGNVNMSRV